MARPETYSRTQIALHWLIAVLVIYQLVLHEGIEQAHRAMSRGQDVGMWNIHVIVGLAVLALVIVRLILRLTRGTPPAPTSEPAPLRILASATHWIFYILLFMLPFSGSAAWFFGAAPAANAHVIAKNVLIALILLHVAGALAHQFYFKTNVLKRMVGRA